jgi:predicted amidohydrolase
MKALEEVMRRIPASTDLVVLPEMFSSGFTMAPQAVAEAPGGAVHQWLQSLSATLGFAICGSIAVQDKGQYYNRFLWAEGGRLKQVYDKRHLFRMAGEHKVYSPGKGHGLIVFKGWRIAPFVCYDLRFPIWCRSGDAAHLQLYVANWPAARVDAWDKLLMARAIENLCYVAGVNRVGEDGKAIAYSGHSAVIDFKGNAIAQAVEHQEEVLLVRLSMPKLKEFRRKFPAHLDADPFEIVL